MHSRRSFLRQGALAATATTVAGPAILRGQSPVHTVGIIGPGGMGSNHVRTLAKNPRVKIAWLCDVDRKRLAAAANTLADAGGGTAKTTGDLRHVLADAAVDAVWIATPDHWHAPATLLALAAGKHVYVEKPCSHNVHEGRLMIDAARRSGKIVQVGTQSRSTAHVRAAIERLRSGAIGTILAAKAWNSQLRSNIGHVPASEPPDTLDYDTWLGPVPHRPYHENFHPGRWRWFRAFGAGDMGNDGVHDIDIAVWGLGVDTHPRRITGSGGKYFFDDDQEFPDTEYVSFEYDSGENKVGAKKQLIFEQRIWSPYHQEDAENGNAWYGTEGMMLLAKSGGWKIIGKGNKVIEEHPRGTPDLAAHHANFLDTLEGKSPEGAHADIATHHFSSTLCHLGNMATLLGRTLHFDPATERIPDDTEANALLRRDYRDHWATPRQV